MNKPRRNFKEEFFLLRNRAYDDHTIKLLNHYVQARGYPRSISFPKDNIPAGALEMITLIQHRDRPMNWLYYERN